VALLIIFICFNKLKLKEIFIKNGRGNFVDIERIIFLTIVSCQCVKFSGEKKYDNMLS
jgi:hypothetical protein